MKLMILNLCKYCFFLYNCNPKFCVMKINLIFFYIICFSINISSQTTIIINSIDDAHIDQANPSGNYAFASNLTTKPFAPSWSKRFLLKADLSSIPQGVQITSAKIKLTVTNYLWASSTIGAFKINEHWQEGDVTWSTFTNNYVGSPTDQKTLVYPSQNIGSQVEWDVLSDVHSMYYGSSINSGWFFRDINLLSNTQAYWDFASSENNVKAYRPVLEVTYSVFTPLPVELLSFNAVCRNNHLEFNWETSSEFNSSNFELLQSRDAVNWQVLHSQAAAGFSSELLEYKYLLEQDFTGGNYYKLKQNDLNGDYVIYEDIILYPNCHISEKMNFQIYPNPNSGKFNIAIENIGNDIQGGVILIYNNHAELVHSSSIQVNQGVQVLSIDEILSSGLYMMNFQSKDLIEERIKFVVR